MNESDIPENSSPILMSSRFSNSYLLALILAWVSYRSSSVGSILGLIDDHFNSEQPVRLCVFSARKWTKWRFVIYQEIKTVELCFEGGNFNKAFLGINWIGSQMCADLIKWPSVTSSHMCSENSSTGTQQKLFKSSRFRWAYLMRFHIWCGLFLFVVGFSVVPCGLFKFCFLFLGRGARGGGHSLLGLFSQVLWFGVHFRDDLDFWIFPLFSGQRPQW